MVRSRVVVWLAEMAVGGDCRVSGRLSVSLRTVPPGRGVGPWQSGGKKLLLHIAE